MCPPGFVVGGGPGDGSGTAATPGAGSDVPACAASLTGSGARTKWGRADQKCTAAKTAVAIRTTASAARVLGSNPHLSRSHTGIRSRSAGATLARSPGAGAETGVEADAGAVAAALPGAGLGVGLGAGAGAEPESGAGAGAGANAEAGTGAGATATPSAGRATRPPCAPPMRASARCREAAATTSARPRADRRRPGPRPGPLRARPGPLPLPLVARCDRGAMPHDGRHIHPNPLIGPDFGGQPSSCGYLGHSEE